MIYRPLIVSVLLVGGCTQHLPVTSAPVDVTFTGTTRNGRLVGYEPTHARVFHKVDGKKTEIEGAECNLQGTGFRARFRSPSIVNLPDYGPATTPVTVTCSYGDRQATVVAAPYNASAESYRSYAAAEAGLVGMLVAETVLSVQKKDNHDFRYRPIEVNLPE